MKKIINILLVVPLLAFAGLDVSKINNALSSITSSKSSSKQLKFYNNNGSLTLTEKLQISSQSGADIILFPKANKSSKVFVVDSYSALKDNGKSIGAIYMKKGRTQIIFVKERLENNGFDIMKVSEKYVIPECKLRSICLIK